MYFDISYGGVRLKPVHSAISLYTVYFCKLILDFSVLPMAGRLATEK